MTPEPQDEPLRVPRELRGVRFDRALERLVPGHSRAQLQKLVRRGRVKLDGRRVLRSNFNLRGGELLQLERQPITPSGGRDQAGGTDHGPAAKLDVLYEDPHLVVVHKPAGCLTHPTERLAGGTLAELAVARYGALPTADGTCRPGIVHRLDRDTSGVMVLARTEAALAQLREQFRRGSVRKRYLALVHGVPDRDELRVDLALGPAQGPGDRQRVDPRGRASRSDFRLLRAGAEHALIECRPHSGRRHQLRVHLLAVGLPIVGDPLYRAHEVPRPRAGTGLALHATSLEFDHPQDGRRCRHEAAPPEAFLRLQERLLGP